MRPSTSFFGPADAARRLGVSAKALRIYERNGLVAPGRTASGWRSYGPDDMARLTYIIGPRGSGKTRLAQRIAEALPGAVFIGLDRVADGAAAARTRTVADPALATRVEATLAWLTEDGATPSDALLALIAALEVREPAFMVVDMVEQGLDQPSQEALIAHLRRRGPDHPPLFLMTRSSAILDLSAIGAAEAILFCPANHSPPTLVAPYPGAPGYEAVATCLASPSVRARLGAA